MKLAGRISLSKILSLSQVSAIAKILNANAKLLKDTSLFDIP